MKRRALPALPALPSSAACLSAAFGQLSGAATAAVIVLSLFASLVIAVLQITFPQESADQLQVWKLLLARGRRGGNAR